MTYTPQYPDHGIRIHELFRAELAKRNLFSVLYGHHADDQTDKIIDELWADILRLHAAEQTYIRTYKRYKESERIKDKIDASYRRTNRMHTRALKRGASAELLDRIEQRRRGRLCQWDNQHLISYRLQWHYLMAFKRMMMLYDKYNIRSSDWLSLYGLI